MNETLPNPVRILIVDDDEEDFFITSEYIKSIDHGEKFIVEWCSDYKEALDLVCRSAYHMYFIDYRLGAKTGLELIQEAIKNHCNEPFVLLTGKGNKEIDVKTMQAGAADYLVKSELNPEKLERCIRYALDRHRFLMELKANEQKFRNIFERSKDAVFITDENLVFKDVNEATCKLLQKSKEELLETSLYQMITNAEDRQLIEAELNKKGEVGDIEVELLTTNKDNIGILSISRQRDMNGMVFTQGIIHDITNLKKAERATLQAEKLKAAGRFVQTLAHEVRNPLNNIHLALEQLNGDIKGENSEIYLEIITRNSHRISSLITELLNSSRPIETPLEKTSLQNALEQSVAAAIDRITLNRINLQTHYANSEAHIMADISKLKIAFLNIIINAVEAMQPDTGILTISLTSDEQQHKVSLTDNGIGISEENLSHLFEPYFTSKRNGLGLGLASTLNILQSHKAQVEVHSKPGKGTTFTISFPKVL
jgi:PAS domain S-box-containing protein